MSVGVLSVELDGALLPLNEIPLQADGALHEIRIVLGNKPIAPEDETVRAAFEQLQEVIESSILHANVSQDLGPPAIP